MLMELMFGTHLALYLGVCNNNIHKVCCQLDDGALSAMSMLLPLDAGDVFFGQPNIQSDCRGIYPSIELRVDLVLLSVAQSVLVDDMLVYLILVGVSLELQFGDHDVVRRDCWGDQ